MKYGIALLQMQPSFLKKRILFKSEHQEKIVKWQKLKQHQDLEFLEVGVDDGVK